MVVLNLRISNVNYFSIAINKTSEMQYIRVTTAATDHVMRGGRSKGADTKIIIVSVSIHDSLIVIFVIHVFSSLPLQLFTISKVYQCIKHVPKVEPMQASIEYYCRITISGCIRWPTDRLSQSKSRAYAGLYRILF